MDIKKLSKQFLLSAAMAVFIMAGGAGINDVWAAIASGTSGTCSWVIDDAGVLTIGPGSLADISNVHDIPWYNYKTQITKIIAKPGTKLNRNQRLFADCTACTEVDLSNLDVSNCTSLSTMFNGCSNLTSCNLAGWNLNKVTSTTS